MYLNEIFVSSLFAGSIAGLTVDVSLFPLDTIKTRLQASEGFRKSGGFRNIYKGIGPQAIGSAPMAAIFFSTYETFKHLMNNMTFNEHRMLVHMSAATGAEFFTCLLKVPIEIVKQRQQTTNRKSWEIIGETYHHGPYFSGFYRGFVSTLLREIPFALIQFPVYEYLKGSYVADSTNSKQVAICGAVAGGLAAGLTTPLDVAKTRIMLAKKSSGSQQLTVRHVLKTVYHENGIKGIFAGFVPRVYMISLGGAIFFGSYNFAKTIYSYGLQKTKTTI